MDHTASCMSCWACPITQSHALKARPCHWDIPRDQDMSIVQCEIYQLTAVRQTGLESQHHHKGCSGSPSLLSSAEFCIQRTHATEACLSKFHHLLTTKIYCIVQKLYQYLIVTCNEKGSEKEYIYI